MTCCQGPRPSNNFQKTRPRHARNSHEKINDSLFFAEYHCYSISLQVAAYYSLRSHTKIPITWQVAKIKGLHLAARPKIWLISRSHHFHPDLTRHAQWIPLPFRSLTWTANFTPYPSSTRASNFQKTSGPQGPQHERNSLSHE